MKNQQEVYLTMNDLDCLPKLQRVVMEAKLSSGVWKPFRQGFIYRIVKKKDEKGNFIKDKNDNFILENEPIKKTELEDIVKKTRTHHTVQKSIKRYL